MNIRPGDGPPGAATVRAPASRPLTADSSRSTADLVKGIADDASTLVRQQLLLARQELTEGATTAAKAGAVLGAAGVVGLYAVGFLLTTIAWALVDAGLPRWAGFGIVTLVLLIVAGVLGLIGQRRMAKAKLTPDQAQAEFRLATGDLVEGAKTGADNVRAEAVATADAVKVGAVTLPDRARTAASDAAHDAREATGGMGAAAGRFIQRLRARVTERTSGNGGTTPRP
jgi:hypothetical protein